MQDIEQKANACATCYMMLIGVDMQRRVKESFPPGPFSKLLSMGQDIPQKATWQGWNAILEQSILKLDDEAYRKALFDVMCQKSHQWREVQRAIWNGQKRKEWV